MVASGTTRVNSAPAGQRGRASLAAGEATSPAHFADRPLFAAIADLLAALDGAGPASRARLNECWRTVGGACSHDHTREYRFVSAGSSKRDYEALIHDAGEIVTRENNWHDFFNALVWMRFPRSKAALNALHVQALRAQVESVAGRGPLRDAATQFDESGIVVAAADPGLLELLARRRWQELFWTRRADVLGQMRFLVFGHGLYDALRAPFYRICGRAATFTVEPAVLALQPAEQCAHLDRLLAERIAERCYPRPRALLALPLLGIPGVTPANECPAYYQDTEQFRPPPDWDVNAVS